MSGAEQLVREILINVTPRETRAVLVENGSAQELYIERAGRRGLVGNLYKGRVSRVLPGMQAAFVDIGLSRTAFLHAGDIARAAAADSDGPAAPVPDIASLVLPGQDVLVQVLKDPLGTKGARLSTVVSLPSRFLVYMPFGRGVGVSARIEDMQTREQLRATVRDLAQSMVAPGSAPAGNGGGYIVRTAAHRAPPEALHADMLYLARLWEHVRQEQLRVSTSTLVHAELPLGARMLRDELSPEVRRVAVDDAAGVLRACASSPRPSCPRRSNGSSTTAALVRCSNCTAWRMRSRAPWIGRCSCSREATSSLTRPSR